MEVANVCSPGCAVCECELKCVRTRVGGKAWVCVRTWGPTLLWLTAGEKKKLKREREKERKREKEIKT